MKTMTSKERLLAAIRFQGPDRVPVWPRLWRYMLARGGSLKVAGYLEFARRFDFDAMPGLAAGSVHLVPHEEFTLPGIGLQLQRRTEGDYTVVERRIETPAGRLSDRTRQPQPGGQFGIAPNPIIDEYLVKGPDDLPALEQLVNAWTAAFVVPDYRAAGREIGGQALISINTCSALSHNAGDACPTELLMIAALENPEFVDRLIEICHRPLMAASRQALENGGEILYCSTFFESASSGWSPDHYRRFFLPRIKAHVDLAHRYGVPYHLYDDGKILRTLPMLREIGVDLLSTICPPPSGDVTLAEARALAGDRVCLNGGIDTVNTLWRGSPETIDQAVREAVAAAATPAGGYIVGTSDSITEEASDENVTAFFAAARRHGTIG